MATLTPGTAAQLATRLRQLVDYGASYKPAADSVLAETIDGAIRYADRLEGMGAAADVLGEGNDVFGTADGLAAQIVDEVMSGSYGPPRPPPGAAGAGWTTGQKVAAVVGGLAAIGVLFMLSDGGVGGTGGHR